MTCSEFAEFLASYLARELDEARRFAFDAHLAVCPDCIAYLRSYAETVELGKSAFADAMAPVPEDVPAELVRAILAANGRERSGPADQ